MPGGFAIRGVVATSLGGSRVCCAESGFCSRGKKREDGCSGVKKRGMVAIGFASGQVV